MKLRSRMGTGSSKEEEKPEPPKKVPPTKATEDPPEATPTPKATKTKSPPAPKTKTKGSSLALPPPKCLGNLAEPNDINPGHSQLMARWKANQALRQSGLETKIAEVVLGENWKERYENFLEGRCPLSFPDPQTWDAFRFELVEIAMEAGLSGWVGLRGSGATFLSMHPEKGVDPDIKRIEDEFQSDPKLPQTLSELHFFDCKVHNQGGKEEVMKKYNEYQLFEVYSDLDINFKSPQLIKMLKENGAQKSDASVGGCFNQDDTMDALPALWEFKNNWGPVLMRDISFVTICSGKDEHGYSKHPFTFAIAEDD